MCKRSNVSFIVRNVGIQFLHKQFLYLNLFKTPNRFIYDTFEWLFPFVWSLTGYWEMHKISSSIQICGNRTKLSKFYVIKKNVIFRKCSQRWHFKPIFDVWHSRKDHHERTVSYHWRCIIYIRKEIKKNIFGFCGSLRFYFCFNWFREFQKYLHCWAGMFFK